MHDASSRYRSDAWVRRTACGALAGAVGVWVMDRVDWFAYRRESERVRRRTTAARPGGLDPAHVIANQLAGLAGRKLAPRQPHPLGMAVHYAVGIAPAALYAVARRRLPAPAAGRGTLYGLALFLVQDEGLNALVGWSGRPGAYPWQAHARGLVAHAVLGLVTESVLRLLDGAPGHRPRSQSLTV